MNTLKVVLVRTLYLLLAVAVCYGFYRLMTSKSSDEAKAPIVYTLEEISPIVQQLVSKEETHRKEIIALREADNARGGQIRSLTDLIDKERIARQKADEGVEGRMRALLKKADEAFEGKVVEIAGKTAGDRDREIEARITRLDNGLNDRVAEAVAAKVDPVVVKIEELRKLIEEDTGGYDDAEIREQVTGLRTEVNGMKQAVAEVQTAGEISEATAEAACVVYVVQKGKGKKNPKLKHWAIIAGLMQAQVDNGADPTTVTAETACGPYLPKK